jgi:hypothetical protein
LEINKNDTSIYRGTIQFGMHYNSAGTYLLVDFTDSDWVDNSDDGKSTTCYIFSFGFRLITWTCKKHQAFSLSLAEAEHRATINASQESLWL